ncbi:hypothetical protein SAMN05444008_1256 [Cnuella takakiae]|uniref:Uncharacterized protein n=1 Tax=Cnuella takakiae TaxID=1302690 RepID=A0A1M5IPK3_9BACT|nr:hypothetical protein SAMN05444008_1256 [Cnuella takakiae]
MHWQHCTLLAASTIRLGEAIAACCCGLRYKTPLINPVIPVFDPDDKNGGHCHFAIKPYMAGVQLNIACLHNRALLLKAFLY